MALALGPGSRQKRAGQAARRLLVLIGRVKIVIGCLKEGSSVRDSSGIIYETVTCGTWKIENEPNKLVEGG